MQLFLLTVLTMCAFAANSVLNRLAVGAGLSDPLVFAVIRLAAGAVTLAVLIGLRRALRGGLVWPDRRGRAVGALSLLVYLFGFSLAYVVLDAGVGALILFGSVQITMFAGALWAREAVPPRRWAGAVLAFAGLVWLMAPGGAVGSALHAGLMALAGIGWGIYSLAGRGQPDALAATGWNFVLALPLGAAALVWAAPMATAQGIWLAVLSGAVSSGLGYALWYTVLPRLGAARAAVAQLTVPVIALLAGVILLDEAVGLRVALAAAVVLAGVALAAWPARR